jgi:predicted ATP-dependent serine protease
MSEITLGFKSTGFQQVGLIKIPDVFYQRFTTGIKSFDELLGGQGFLPGSAFTVTGKAGAGKTTFLLQMLEALQVNGKLTGYASGEESQFQIAYNANRLGLTKVQVANMTDVDELAESMKHLDVLIIDSFQFLTCKHISKPLALQRYAIKHLVEAAQREQCVLGIIQHLTTMGSAKGGTLVPHTVDMNMEIETDETDETHKIIRVYKNRFGRCGEIMLEMTDKGFDFEKVIKHEQTEKMSKALQKGEKEKAKILEYINEHGEATLDELHAVVGKTWRVQHYLRILTNENQITKEGRGQTAKWSKAGES